MGFIETSYGGKPNLSDVNIDSILNMGNYGITASGNLNILNTMNLNNNDLIGVKRFLCEDYLGAVKAVASNNTKWTLTLDDVSSYTKSKKFRVPSNFVPSKINISFYATNMHTSSDLDVFLMLYDPDTDSYTKKSQVTIPKNTTTQTEFTISNISVEAGEIYAMQPNSGASLTFYGSSGLKIQCDLSPVTGGYWEVEE